MTAKAERRDGGQRSTEKLDEKPGPASHQKFHDGSHSSRTDKSQRESDAKDRAGTAPGTDVERRHGGRGLVATTDEEPGPASSRRVHDGADSWRSDEKKKQGWDAKDSYRTAPGTDSERRHGGRKLTENTDGDPGPASRHRVQDGADSSMNDKRRGESDAKERRRKTSGTGCGTVEGRTEMARPRTLKKEVANLLFCVRSFIHSFIILISAVHIGPPACTDPSVL